MAICKVCNNDKPKHRRGLTNYVNNENKFWLGRVCPDCAGPYKKEHYRKTPPLKDVQCKECNKEFKQGMHKHAFCSNACRMKDYRRRKRNKRFSGETPSSNG